MGEKVASRGRIIQAAVAQSSKVAQVSDPNGTRVSPLENRESYF